MLHELWYAMKGLIITDPGMGHIAALDVKGILGAKASAHDDYAEFEFNEFEQLFTLIYTCQSAQKILALEASFEFCGLKPLLAALRALDLGSWLGKETTFRVSARMHGDFSLTNDELCRLAGEALIDGIEERSGYRQKVDLTSPEVFVFIYLSGKRAFVGIDLAGIDLDKREYRVFLHPGSIKGTLAYGLVRMSGYAGPNSLLDPFVRCGEIPIEAALYATGKAVHHYSKNKLHFVRMNRFASFGFDAFFEAIDSKAVPNPLRIHGLDSLLKYVVSAKKNAKIGGVHKQIEFARVDLDWLDTRFDEKSFDCIVTKLPHIHDFDEKAMLKHLREFFYQAEFILAAKGRIVAATLQPDRIAAIAKEYKLKLKETKELHQGEEKIYAMVFIKGSTRLKARPSGTQPSKD